jgi:hypothetical protein
MSSDRRPAKVRVVTSGAGQSQAAPIPARRRDDVPQGDDGGQASMASVEGAAKAPGGSLLWVAATIVLFLAGCAIGGVLFVMSGFSDGALL